MKKINILTSILVATALLTACEDDRDSNSYHTGTYNFCIEHPCQCNVQRL